MTFTLPPNVNNPYLAPTIAIPSALEITTISNTNPMVVTVEANSDQMNTYIPGQKVKLTVPVQFGMWQANGLTAQIVAVGTNTLTLNVNAAQFDPFVIPGSTNMIASLAPSGSSNLQFSNLTSQVPFQSLNNIGN